MIIIILNGRKFAAVIAILVAGLILTACGGGGGESAPAVPPNNPGTTLTGIFIDSLVSGLHYQTATKSGTTNSAGEYLYVAGETVTFSIGGITLGSTLAGPIITPLSLVGGATSINDPAVLNIVRLLLSLDDDGIPANGINITPAVQTAAAAMMLSFNSVTFDTDAQAFIDAVRGGGTPLVTTIAAADHLNNSLKTSWGTMQWGNDCWQQQCS